MKSIVVLATLVMDPKGNNGITDPKGNSEVMDPKGNSGVADPKGNSGVTDQKGNSGVARSNDVTEISSVIGKTIGIIGLCISHFDATS